MALTGAKLTPNYAFDWLYLKRFARLHKYLFPLKSMSTLLLFILVCVCGAEQFLVFKLGMLPGAFVTELSTKDYEAFVTLTLQALVIVFSMVSRLINLLQSSNNHFVGHCQKYSYVHSPDFGGGMSKVPHQEPSRKVLPPKPVLRP